MPPPSSLASAREDHEAARALSAKRLTEVAVLETELQSLIRDRDAFDPLVVAARATLEQARNALRGARGDEQKQRDVVRRELDSWLRTFVPDDIQETTELTTSLPIVLLPVKLQARFLPVGAPTELLVRLYPDEISADTHERALTPAERTAGIAYWTGGWKVGDEPDEWRTLLRRYPPQRAAWIVRQTTPTNLAARPSGAPSFPKTDERPASWTRAAEARLLPDRWLVIAYRAGSEVRRAVSRPVRDPLALTPDPAEDDPMRFVDVSGDGLQLDERIRWMVDFKEAEAAGMAVRLPVDATDVRLGFGQLLAVGVKASIEPREAGDRLASLLEGHRYSRGLALVPQGTPTNNTAERRSGHPPEDVGGATSFGLERQGWTLKPENDGPILVSALGLASRLGGEFAHVSGAEGWDQRSAGAMNEALWPVALGYYLEQMLAPGFDRAVIGQIRSYFVSSVRGCGPYPAFRVGDAPYGVLPVSSLARWAADRGASPVDAKLPPALAALYGLWQSRTGEVTRLRGGADPDGELLDVLSMDASAREVRIRAVWGADLVANLFQLYGTSFWGIQPPDWNAWVAKRDAIAREVKNRLVTLGWPPAMRDPRVARTALDGGTHRFRWSFVTDDHLSDSEPLGAQNYIDWVQRSPWTGLRGPPLDNPPLLYLLLKHGMLLEYARSALDILIADGAASEDWRREPELVGIPTGSAGLVRPAVWDRLARPAPSTGAMPLGEYLFRGNRANTASTDAYRATLNRLAPLSTGQLERLLTETLDTCSHRLDAWITSLPSRRLRDMRKAEPDGCHLGGFGWLEDLRPLDASLVEERQLPDGRTVSVQRVGGGYLHAPSMLHAAAAAVLRSGYLNRGGEAARTFALNLSSARVRKALWLLDAVREGQPLGAVLGYRFERGLHERSGATVSLEKFITSLRSLYPLVAPVGGGAVQPPAGAARGVLDGLALWRQWQKTRALPSALSPTPSTDERDAIEGELGRVDEWLDAAADLLVAESVYQMVRGTTAGAGASLEAMAEGVRPPEPEIAATPRGGPALTHRVLLVLGGDPPGTPGWPQPTPRADAEPHLDGWLGTLLGDPSAYGCRVEFPAGEPEPDRRTRQTVTLAELGLRPIDVLALAAEMPSAPQASEIDRRVADVVIERNSHAGLVPEDVAITYAPDPSWNRRMQRSFLDALELARAVARLVGGARPLRAGDLLAPSRAAAAAAASSPADGRVADARRALARAHSELDRAVQDAETQVGAGAPLRLGRLLEALRAASLLGVPGAFPGGRGVEEVLAQGGSVSRELHRRRDAASSAALDDGAVMQGIFGRGFVFLPRFLPSSDAADELDQALAAAPGLVASDPDAPRKWLQQAARVREPLSRLRRVGLYAAALGTDAASLEVAQLPHVDGATWLGLPFGGSDPPAGRLSLLVHRVGAPAARDPWVGLLLDEWSEVLPRSTEQTGVAFHYDDAGAEAPQAVLLAVPPDRGAAVWTPDTLVAVLLETLELAKIRGVEVEMLDELGQLLPAAYPAWNTEGDTVETKFLTMRGGDLTL